ncbi:MAG TPA: WHG domain-containing protein, partial [Spirochaetia bacterium]|nr:WHG domain-containing protein [Spirochaetia bacterium]
RNLAAEIGVSPGAPYRHFPSADALIAALAARGFGGLVAAMEAATPRTLSAIGTAYVRYAAAHPELYRAMYHFPVERLAEYPELAEQADRAFALLKTSVEESRGSGGGSSPLAATAAWAYVHGLSGLVINRLTTSVNVADSAQMEELMRTFARVIPVDRSDR